MKYILQRQRTGDSGTFGVLFLYDGTVLHTGELPWHDNAPDVSCIPPGIYQGALSYSPHFNKNLYHLEDVPGRSNVMIHPANWMGDASKGLKCQLEGCIALGLSVGDLEGQDALISSQVAIARFSAEAANGPITLQIFGVPA